MSLVVVRATGFITVQDRGRPGHMHVGLPPGGALVPSLLARANRLSGNTEDAAGIEVSGQLVVRAERDIVVATDRGRHPLAAGAELVIDSEPSRVSYLALAGGIDSPIVLGSRAAQLSAGLGALVRAGDHILAASSPTGAAVRVDVPASADAGAPIRIVPGPDLEAFAPDALDALCAATYRISPASDRVGTRLVGAALARTGAPERSRPMTLGAIEVPRDGRPIVLGPEHPTTGGYPIVAVVAADDLDRVFSIRLGGDVRFRA